VLSTTTGSTLRERNVMNRGCSTVVIVIPDSTSTCLSTALAPVQYDVLLARIDRRRSEGTQHPRLLWGVLRTAGSAMCFSLRVLYAYPTGNYDPTVTVQAARPAHRSAAVEDPNRRHKMAKLFISCDTTRFHAT
jgi:hypothetical protein